MSLFSLAVSFTSAIIGADYHYELPTLQDQVAPVQGSTAHLEERDMP